MEEQYQVWLEKQGKNRSGEALRRLQEGHGHNEKLFAQTIWFPAVGNFDDLHAEYEVTNFRDGSYYLDYAYIRQPYRIDWEVDDFSTHAKMVTRRSFDYERERQNQLMADGWLVFRFTLDAIKERPRRCQQFVLQVMGKLYGNGMEKLHLSLEQREIMRLAVILQRPFTPTEMCGPLGIQAQYARKVLHGLVEMQLLAPASGSARIRTYTLGPKADQWR
jgi:hypothetical protein